MDIHEAMSCRICEPIKFCGAPEDVIKILLYQNVISPVNEARRLPFNSFKSEVVTGKTTNLDLKYENLAEVVKRLCAEYGLALLNHDDAVILTYA